MSSWSREEILQAVLEVLGPRVRESLPEVEVDGSFRIFEAGVLDSMAFIDVLSLVDAKLNNAFLLEELDFDEFDTVDELIEQLQAIQQGD